MNNSGIAHHSSEAFSTDLENIRNQVLVMGQLVEQQIALAMTAFASGDFKVAKKSINLIDSVTDIKASVDDACLQLLAAHTAVELELRFLITIIKIVHELKSVGELAKSVAKITIQFPNGKNEKSFYQEILDVFTAVDTNLASVLAALSDIHIDCSSLHHTDQESVGDYTTRSLQAITQIMQHSKSVTPTLYALRIVKLLERIGDHGSHIQRELSFLSVC